MASAFEARAIRDAFSMFWRKNSGHRLPADLKGITISNVSTFATRVRVRLLKELCRRHQDANPHLSCFVTNYLPRPELKIRNKKGPMVTFSYSAAITRLSHHLTPEFLTELCKFARTNIPEDELADRFLVLNPDMLGLEAPDLGEVNTSSMSVDLVPTVNTSTPLPSQAPQSQPSATNQSLPIQTATDGFVAVTKKQRSRFAKKSLPYDRP
jgi:hypothetical protein